MNLSNKCDLVIAESVFRIIASSFGGGDGTAHNCFRVKNLRKEEILEFIGVWESEAATYGLNDVKVIIAGDSGQDYPAQYKAEKERSITWYRNNNENGLIYLETKTESDEQGLKNIFTLQDRNFLDGFFDDDEFNVPQTIVERCWHAADEKVSELPTLLPQRLIEVLDHLHPAKTQVPVRKFIKFALACCHAYRSNAESRTAEQQSELIGEYLVHLGLFPDEMWRTNDSEVRTSRRLELNLSYAELATTSNSDIEPEEVQRICQGLLLRDANGNEYSADEQKRWKLLCIDYSGHRDPKVRAQIPFRIFEQLFAKDVKGLQLGDRVEQEIESIDPGRLEEFYKLNVQGGLNTRVQEHALVLLDADAPEIGLPLADLLSKQTRRMVEKVAYPTPERFLNPLIKLAEVARDFHASYGMEHSCRIEIRLGRGGDASTPAMGLLAFLYGATLKSVIDESSLSTSGYELAVDDCFLNPVLPPPPQQESDDFEDELHIDWSPIPVDFALVSSEGDTELDVSGNHEWLPDYYPYLALLWIRIADQQLQDFYQSIRIPSDIAQDEWLLNICNRALSFNDCFEPVSSEEVTSCSLLNELADHYASFCTFSRERGLSRETINELVDRWSITQQQAKLQYVPEGKIDERLRLLLAREFVKVSGSDKLLMLPSHPIRLRWIAEYLRESERNANLALAGKLRLNEKNDKLYLKWISDLSPHQQPPVAVTAERSLLFASGELGWCEEFSPLGKRERASQGGILDYASISEMGAQVRAYLEAHPYKQDGLKLLLVLQHGGRIAAELIKEIRKGDFKATRITIHVLAPSELWEEVVSHFEKLPTENRISEGSKLFPPLQLRLHEFEYNGKLKNAIGDQQFDIALVPGFLRDQLAVQHNTEPEGEREGKLDPLLDNPSCVYGGQKGGEIAVSMVPRGSDLLLSNWSTLSVRHARSGPVSKQQPENTDFIELKINFQDTARLYEELHEITHWVIFLERYITREQVESLEPQPDILTVRDKVGTSGLYTLIVSSNSGKGFIVNRLQRKLTKIAQSGEIEITRVKAELLAEKIYEETRKVSPRLVLQAMGISRVTEEILGLMIAMHLADAYKPAKPADGVIVWISLDEHPEWFNGNSVTRADLCRITLERVADELHVDVLVVEGKFRQVYDHHGVDQVNSSLDLFKSIIVSDQGDDEPLDARLWREHLLAAMENVNPDARACVGLAADEIFDDKYRLPEKIRSDFRNGKYRLRSMGGLFSICLYNEEGELKDSYESNGDVQIVKSYRSQIHALVEGYPSKYVRLENTNSVAGNEILHNKGKGEPCRVSAKDDATETVDTGYKSQKSPSKQGALSEQDLVSRYQRVLDKFGEFGVSVEQPDDPSMRYVEGPASILYRIKPGQAVDPKRLFEKADVLKLALALDQEQNIRFGNHKGYVTIDVPKNEGDRYFVDAYDMWQEWNRPSNELSAPLGEDSYGNIVDLNFSSSNSPHLLIGGTTGSGKSEALNTILDGLIRYYNAEELRLMLVDPKGTELQQYEGSEHLEGSIGWDDADAIGLLERAVNEMQNRYGKLKKNRTRSLPEYNLKVDEADRIPWWVVVLDEYADLTSEKESKKEIEGHLKRLAQKARAAGIHVIIATQKPSSEVISTNLRSNLPAQLALRVKSSTESRVIIDEVGAETLNGKGDALLKAEGKLTRVQCAKV